MNFVLTVQNCDEIIELFSTDKDWCETVFGLQTVTKYNVTGFFCQPLATKISTVELLCGKSIALVIAHTPDDKFVYNSPMNWEGMHFFKRGRGGAAVQFNVLVNSVIQTQQMVEEY